MISIIYDRSVPSIYLTGHANSAPFGQDLVCASCSALVYGLYAAVRKEARGPYRAKIEKGKAEISCERANKRVRAIFDGYAEGFKVISRSENKFVSYEEKN